MNAKEIKGKLQLASELLYVVINNDGFECDEIDDAVAVLDLIERVKSHINGKGLEYLVENAENAKEDEAIIKRVEALRDCFTCEICGEDKEFNKDDAVKDTIEELRQYRKFVNWENKSPLETTTLSAFAFFALIHQETELDLDYEVVDKNEQFAKVTDKGLDSFKKLLYEVTFGPSNSLYLYLYLKNIATDDMSALAIIKTKEFPLEEILDAYRELSALGCEYQLAARCFPEL